MAKYYLDKNKIDVEVIKLHHEIVECFNQYSEEFDLELTDFGFIDKITLDKYNLDELKKAGFTDKQVEILNDIISYVVKSTVELFVKRT